MTAILEKTLKRAALGFFIGVFVGNVLSALSGWPDAVVTDKLLGMCGGLAPALLVHTLLSGALGAVSFAGMSLYDVEGWSLLRIAVAHYLIIEAAYLPIGSALGWFAEARAALVWMLCCAAVYLVIFLILWALYRRQVRELNRLNEQRKEEKEQQMEVRNEKNTE